VLNAVKQAMTVSGLRKVHAVLGGFHLAPHNEDYVRQTIKGLVDLDVDHIVPMHCWDRSRGPPASHRLVAAT
jgi:7,8-dihydropterin-6-yl-methyl-4-(beta-D-ribofuranosyl)aminobenzene 5'-phosphate synthase